MLSVSTQITTTDSLILFERMLKSIAFADEIIIFNMERRDQEFVVLARAYHARVIEVETPKIVELIRSRQLAEAHGDWVLIMDGDEIIPPALKSEIQSVVKSPSLVSAYYLTRRNFSLGYPLVHGGWGVDSVLRLFRRADFISWGKEIHSLPKVKGPTAVLINPMEHHKDESLEQMVDKTNRYSDIESQQFLDGGLPRVTAPTLIRKWWMESFRRGVMKGGLLDGPIGLIQSMYQGFSVLISYAKLYEKQMNNRQTL